MFAVLAAGVLNAALVPQIVKSFHGGRERTVPLMQGVAGAVKDYLAVRRTLLRGPDHGALLLDRHGKRVEVGLLRAVLFQLGRKRGRRLHPHLFRHSIAVHLLRGGAAVRHVQQFLGHANLETTKIYLRMVPGHLRDDYDKAMPLVDVGLPVVQPPAGGDRPASADVPHAGDDVGAGQDEHDQQWQGGKDEREGDAHV
jgi:site-specific recombinase XerD